MTGTTDLAVRRPGGRLAQAPSAALELHNGQTMWTKDQHAALVAMGIPREATSAELGVFLHQCQRTGLDPFSKQIYLIYRKTYENGREINKPTMQVGIDGYRVIRDRIAKRDGLRVEYEPTVWYDADGGAHEAWLWDDPPAACRVAISVDGRRFSSVLRFNEYSQKKKDGTLNSMWATKGAHMIEKCCEADVLRRVFPNDLAGVMLEDTAPMPEDAPPAARERITREQLAERRQTVTATVVTPDVPPAESSAPAAAPQPPVPAEPAGGTSNPDAPVTAVQVTRIIGHCKRLGWGESAEDREGIVSAVNRLLRLNSPVPLDKLTSGQADEAAAELARFGEGDAQGLMDYLNDGVVPDGE